MKFQTKKKILKHRRYFETGVTLTKYCLYLIGLFGVSSNDIKATLLLGVIFGVLSYIIGYIYFKYGFMLADTEISNEYNLFVKEMRNKIK